MTTTDQLLARIQELRAVCEKVTPGPWNTMPDPFDAGIKAVGGTLVAGLGPAESHERFMANRNFIEQSRTTLPNALAALEGLVKEVNFHIQTATDSITKDLLESAIEQCALALLEGKQE